MKYKKGMSGVAVLGVGVLIAIVCFLIYIENKPEQELVNNNTEIVSDESSQITSQNSQQTSTQQTVTTSTNVGTNTTANSNSGSTNTSVTSPQLSDTYVCPYDDTPSFFITSPNGGEQYQSGQNITLTWESCNIPPTAIFSRLDFRNVNDATKNRTIWVAGGEAGWEGMPSPLNDESEIIPLSNSQTGITVESGTYEVCMTGVWVGNTPPGQGISVSDCSDETFVIN